MKTQRFLMLILLTFAVSFVSAQNPVARESTAKFMKKLDGNSISITIQGQQKNVSDYLVNLFKEETGKKPKFKLGGAMQIFEGVNFGRVSTSTLDIYFRVEKAGGKSKNQSLITMFLSAGNNNFLTSSSHPDEMNAAMAFLESVEFEVQKYEMELAIEEQTGVVDKHVKEHQKMVKDSIDLEKRLEETLKAIDENKIARANQLRRIDEERARLGDMKTELDRLKMNSTIIEDEYQTREEEQRDSGGQNNYRRDDGSEYRSSSRDEYRQKSLPQSPQGTSRETVVFKNDEDDRSQVRKADEVEFEEDSPRISEDAVYRRDDRYREDDRYRDERDRDNRDRYYDDRYREDDRYRDERDRDDYRYSDRDSYDDRKRDDRYQDDYRERDDDRDRRYEDRRYENRPYREDDRYRDERDRRYYDDRDEDRRYREDDRYKDDRRYREDDRYRDERDRDNRDRYYDDRDKYDRDGKLIESSRKEDDRYKKLEDPQKEKSNSDKPKN